PSQEAMPSPLPRGAGPAPAASSPAVPPAEAPASRPRSPTPRAAGPRRRTLRREHADRAIRPFCRRIMLPHSAPSAQATRASRAPVTLATLTVAFALLLSGCSTHLAGTNDAELEYRVETDPASGQTAALSATVAASDVKCRLSAAQSMADVD